MLDIECLELGKRGHRVVAVGRADSCEMGALPFEESRPQMLAWEPRLVEYDESPIYHVKLLGLGSELGSRLLGRRLQPVHLSLLRVRL
jgi:hypothetical protein